MELYKKSASLFNLRFSAINRQSIPVSTLVRVRIVPRQTYDD